MSEKCCEKVFRHYRYYPCGNAAKNEHNGKWYCGTHHPEAVEARQKKRKAEYDRRSANRDAQWAKQARNAKRAELFPELVNALSELYAVTPSTAPGIGLEGAKDRHAAACKLAVDVLAKSKALL